MTIPASTISLVSIQKISTKAYSPSFITLNNTRINATPTSFSTLPLASFSQTPPVVDGAPVVTASPTEKSGSEYGIPREVLRIFLGSVCVMVFMLL